MGSIVARVESDHLLEDGKFFSDVFSYTFELRNILKFPSFGTRSEMLGRLSDSLTLRRRGQTRWLESPLTDGCGYTQLHTRLCLIGLCSGVTPDWVWSPK